MQQIDTHTIAKSHFPGRSIRAALRTECQRSNIGVHRLSQENTSTFTIFWAVFSVWLLKALEPTLIPAKPLIQNLCALLSGWPSRRLSTPQPKISVNILSNVFSLPASTETHGFAGANDFYKIRNTQIDATKRLSPMTYLHKIVLTPNSQYIYIYITYG